jgi:hypothetical protein
MHLRIFNYYLGLMGILDLLYDKCNHNGQGQIYNNLVIFFSKDKIRYMLNRYKNFIFVIKNILFCVPFKRRTVKSLKESIRNKGWKGKR